MILLCLKIFRSDTASVQEIVVPLNASTQIQRTVFAAYSKRKSTGYKHTSAPHTSDAHQQQRAHTTQQKQCGKIAC